MSNTLESIEDGGVFVVARRRYGMLPEMVAVASSLHGAARVVVDDAGFIKVDSDGVEDIRSSEIAEWQTRGMWDDENKVFADLAFGKCQGEMSWHWDGEQTDYVVFWTDIVMDKD